MRYYYYRPTPKKRAQRLAWRLLGLILLVLLLGFAKMFWVASAQPPASYHPPKAHIASAHPAAPADQATLKPQPQNQQGGLAASGKTVLAPQYDAAFAFGDNGLARVLHHGNWFYINRQNQKVIDASAYDSVGDFGAHHIAVVEKAKRYGLINAQGKTLLPTRAERVYLLNNGVATALVGGQYIFINQNGKQDHANAANTIARND